MNDHNNTKKTDKPTTTHDDVLIKRPNPVLVSQESVVEVAKRHSSIDIALWLVAILCLIGATLVPNYLAGVWAQASQPSVKITLLVVLILVAVVCLALTHQGRAFKTLLKDAGVELRRITWPSKDETTTYTWQVIVVTVIAGILIWLLDNLFNYFVGLILG